MVCWIYQWSAESTNMVEPPKKCVKKSRWSADSTNGLLSLQKWLNPPRMCQKIAMVCRINQWSAESTNMVQPKKLCDKYRDGLLILPMVCWVYKNDWTPKNMSSNWRWSAESTNGLLSLQIWLNHCEWVIWCLMVCSVYKWSGESTRMKRWKNLQWSAESTNGLPDNTKIYKCCLKESSKNGLRRLVPNGLLSNQC